MLVLNKTDLVSSEDLFRLKGILQKLNPAARMVESQFGVVSPKLAQCWGSFLLWDVGSLHCFRTRIPSKSIPSDDEQEARAEHWQLRHEVGEHGAGMGARAPGTGPQA